MGAGFSVSHSLCSKLVGASLSIGYSFNDALRKKLIEQFETSEATNPPGECCLFPIRWFNMLLKMKFLAQFRQLMLWFFLKRAKAALNCWVENQNVCRSFYSTCSVRKKNKNKNNPEVVYLLEGGTPYLISIYLHSSCFVLRDITNGYQSIHYLYNSSLTQCSEKWKPLFSTGMQMVLALKRLCSVKTFWTW